MTRGAPLFLAIVALGASPLYAPRPLAMLCVGVLFALWLLTLCEVKRAPRVER